METKIIDGREWIRHKSEWISVEQVPGGVKTHFRALNHPAMAEPPAPSVLRRISQGFWRWVAQG